MRRRKETLKRLQSVLMYDKIQAPSNFCELVKRDVYKALNDYFDMSEKGMDFSLELSRDGKYMITVSAKATRLKNVPMIF